MKTFIFTVDERVISQYRVVAADEEQARMVFAIGAQEELGEDIETISQDPTDDWTVTDVREAQDHVTHDVTESRS